MALSVASDLSDPDTLASMVLARFAVIEYDCDVKFRDRKASSVTPSPPKVATSASQSQRVCVCVCVRVRALVGGGLRMASQRSSIHALHLGNVFALTCTCVCAWAHYPVCQHLRVHMRSNVFVCV